jgi:hypothetical protein
MGRTGGAVFATPASVTPKRRRPTGVARLHSRRGGKNQLWREMGQTVVTGWGQMWPSRWGQTGPSNSTDKKKLKATEQRDGHYLLRSNLTGEDPPCCGHATCN